MAEEEDKPKEKRFTKEFAEKYSKTSDEESTPEDAILEKQRKLLEKDPKNVKVWFARGLLLMDMGRSKDALECMDRVVDLNHAHPGVWNARAEVLRRLGRDEEAADSLRKALEHIGPQVDEGFKEKMAQAEGVEDLLKEAGGKEPEEEEPQPPEGEEPSEEVTDVLEELEMLGAVEETPEEMTPEEREYRAKIQAWAAQGFDVSPLEHVLDDEPYKARTVFFQFEQNVAKIAVLKETLDGISVPGFEDDVSRLREAMKAPMNIWKVEAEMGRLLPRVEERGKELVREAASLAKKAEKEKPAAPRATEPKVTKPPSLRPTEGKVNGLVNGLAARGRVNGLAAGGKVNGVAGRVNGLVNGLQSARRGLTNGLTNGNGFTNGLGSSRFRRETMYRRWKVGIIPAIAAILLILTIFNAPTTPNAGPLGGINVDGNPSDWSGISGYAQTQYVPVDNVNITNYRSVLKDNVLSFLIQVKGSALGDTSGMDSFYTFVDGDGSKTTGYRLPDMGADFMIEVSGANGVVNASAFSSFNDNNPGGNDNWSAWQGVGSVVSAASGSFLEFQIDAGRMASSRITFDSVKFEAVIISDDNSGVSSSTVAKMGAAYGALLVHQEGGPVTLNSGGIQDLLRVTFEAVGGPVHINQLQYAKSSKTVVSNSPSNMDVLPSQTEQRNVTVDTAGTSPGDFVSLEITSVDADRPVTILGESARAYIGAVPPGRTIDGIFADWNPLDFSADPGSVWPPGLDIVHYASNKTSANAFFYVDVRGSIMAGTLVPQQRQTSVPSQGVPSPGQPAKPKRGEDLMRVYVDSDSQDGQGLSYLGLPGADYLVEIRGRNGKITSRACYKWTGGVWQSQAGVPSAENDQKRMEIGLSLSGITVNSMQIAFESSSWRNIVDTTDVGSVRSKTRGSEETTYETLYGVSLPNEISSGGSIRYTAGSGRLEWSLPSEIVLVDAQGMSVLSNLSPAMLVTKEDWAKYDDAYPEIGTDVVYLVEETSLKEQFVINRPIRALASDGSGEVRFSFTLKIDPALMVFIDGTESDGGIATLKPISFTDGYQEKFTIPSAVAWDSSGRSVALPYTWDKTGPTLTIDVPASFLLDSVYPVCVDPWVNYTIKNTGPLSGGTEQFGNSVALGDFNNDGYADLLVGAYANSKNYSTGGAAYIYLGPLTSDKLTPSVNIPGTAATYKKGQAVAAGKFNNDDYWDALVTQYIDKPALIYYGRSSWPLWVTSADVTINAQSYGASPGSPRFGFSAAGGNLDGAFYDDVVIGAPGNRNSGSTAGIQDGCAFVFLSPFSSTVSSANFTLLPPDNSSGQFGSSLATGLVDNDAKYDVMGGEPYYFSSLGRASFYKGSSLSSGSGVRMPNANVSGRKVGERFGYSIAIGKLDSDAYEDIAIGAPYNGISGNNGKVYLYLAAASGISTNQVPSAEVLNQSTGEQFGTAVLIGPFLGSNEYNLAVGAPYAAAGGTNRGSVYIFNAPLSSSTPTKTQSGDFDNDYFGSALAGGKFANDDFYRIAVGNPKWAANGAMGRVVIMSFIPEFSDAAIAVLITLGFVLVLGRRRKKAGPK